MCGIVGYFSSNPGPRDRFKLFKIIKQSRIRGLHSFGQSYLENDKIITQKYLQNEFRKIDIPYSNMVIFHNRYCTSGDYKNPLNNQPIHIEDVSLAFNGVIDMRTKEEMEIAYNIRMQTENDGEVLLKSCKKDPLRMLEFIQQKGSFSGLLIKDQTLYAMTNGRRPLWMLKDGDSVFLASTRDIFRRALGDVEPTQLQINELHQWNTK
jgi:glutamine phosphoribosylpyrophosphate amidotransferase